MHRLKLKYTIVHNIFMDLYCKNPLRDVVFVRTGPLLLPFRCSLKKKYVLGVVILLANSYGYGTYLRTVQYRTGMELYRTWQLVKLRKKIKNFFLKNSL